MKRRSVLLCFALACAALGGCRSTEAPPVTAPPAVVVAPPLVVRLTEWDEYTGRFEATDRVEIRARVDGYLDSIHFRDGAMVKPGDLLFVIDPRPVRSSARRGSRRRRTGGHARRAGHHRLHPRGGAVRDPGHQPGGVRPPGAGAKGSRSGPDRGTRSRATGCAERGVHARARADRRPHLPELRERRQRDVRVARPARRC